MNDNRKIVVNSVIIFIRLVVTTVIGVVASRIVLDALGASDYGLNNVVGGIIGMLGVFNNAMLSTTYRFIAAELGRGENGNLNKVFNTSMMIHAGFALFILILGCTVGLCYVNNYLNVEPGKLADARYVFFLSMTTAFISTLFVPYQGLLTAYEKFSVLAIRDIVFYLLYLGALLLFIYSDGSRLRIYANIHLVYQLLSCGSFLLVCRRLFKDVVKHKIYHDLKLVKEMFSYAVWTLFGASAAMFKTQGSNILINFFFGTVVNAAFAIANTVEAMISTFARSLNSAAVPQITKGISGGNQGRSITLTSYISKYTFILMAVVAFPVMLEMDFLLGLWLKKVPEGATIFCQLMILGALVGTLGEGIPALVNATGNIRTYQIIYHTFNMLGLPIAWLFFKMGYNQYSIGVVYCCVYFISTFLRLFLLKKLFYFDIMQIVRISYTRILVISIPLVIFYCVYNPLWFSSFWGHALGIVFSELFLVVIIGLLGFDKNERKMITEFIKSRL